MKIQIYDSKNKKNKTEFTDSHTTPNTTYVYSIIPYVSGKNGIKYGEEFFFNEIKTPPKNNIGDDWWKEFFQKSIFG